MISSQKFQKERTLREEIQIVIEYSKNNKQLTHCILIWNILMLSLLGLLHINAEKTITLLNQFYLVCSYWIAAFYFGHISSKLNTNVIYESLIKTNL